MLRFGLSFLLVAASMFLMPKAAAEGRCEERLPEPCLRPQRGEPGTLVEVTRATFRVVWNEDRPGALGFHYRPDQERILLLTVEDGSMREGMTFRVPDVPPGSYEVVIYEEDSYWWDRFTVTRPGPDWRPYLALGILLLVIVGAFVVNRMKPHQTGASEKSGD